MRCGEFGCGETRKEKRDEGNPLKGGVCDREKAEKVVVDRNRVERGSGVYVCAADDRINMWAL